MAFFETSISSRDEIITNITAQLTAQGWATLFTGDGVDAGTLDTEVSQARVMQDVEGNVFHFWSRAMEMPAYGEIPVAVVQGCIYSAWDPAAPSIWDQTANAYYPNAYNELDIRGRNDADTSSSTASRYNFPSTDGEPTYLWLFTGPTYCHAVWQSVPGKYHHFNFGTIDKGYPFNGGMFMCGSWRHTSTSTSTTYRNPESYYHCAPFNQTPNEGSYPRGRDMYVGDFDGQVMRMARGTTSTSSDTHGLAFRGAFVSRAYRLSVPPHTNRTTLIPFWPVVKNNSTNNAYCQGKLPAVRRANIAFHQPAEQLVYEAETWRIFPWSIKRSSLQTGTGMIDPADTYIFAMAYKE